MPVDIAAGYDQVLQQYLLKRQKLYWFSFLPVFLAPPLGKTTIFPKNFSNDYSRKHGSFFELHP
jgi:hypothetical protein